MSTFDGFCQEFPLIRIDQFRALRDRPPPLACFLSHVHSDHLGGLENLKAPFVYCSPTTRELLLRLEKFPHRMNFNKNILERRLQTYSHLKPLLKPIPLETPTLIELCPGNSITVTLFDANHCSGAVMFLIEGQGKAILYTGDIRSEDWWVRKLVQHPKLVKYTFGRHRLDTVYLDTTFATKVDKYLDFQPKSEGLRELLEKIERYPEDTIFYFNAWTFGYEDVWLALSQVLGSRVHLDRYRYEIYTSVKKNNGPGLECPEAPILWGFKVGNGRQEGILTDDHTVRLHSCEKNTGCPIWNPENAHKVVMITPIIARHGDVEMREAGAGGGYGDLNASHELDLSDPMAVQQLLMLCAAHIKDKALLEKIILVLIALQKQRKGLGLDSEDDDRNNGKLELDKIPLEELPDMLVDMAKHGKLIRKEEDDIEEVVPPPQVAPVQTAAKPLPRAITFPYSRHSSHNELRGLLAALRPRDVWPNTYAPPQHWDESMSMESMFGDLCDRDKGQPMAFDKAMRAAVADIKAARKHKRDDLETQRPDTSSQREESDDENCDAEDTQESELPSSPPRMLPERSPEPAHEHAYITNAEETQQSTIDSSLPGPQQLPEHAHEREPDVTAKHEAVADSSANLEVEDTLMKTGAKNVSQVIPEAQAPTPGFSEAELIFSSLDDRISEAFVADNIDVYESENGDPYGSQSAKDVTTLSSTGSKARKRNPAESNVISASAKTRLAKRHKALRAAANGLWGNEVELESTQPKTDEIRRQDKI